MDGEDNGNYAAIEEFPDPRRRRWPSSAGSRASAPRLLRDDGQSGWWRGARSPGTTSASSGRSSSSPSRSRASTGASRRRPSASALRGSSPQFPWREIVGVSGNERDDGLTQPATAIVYWPMLNESYRVAHDGVRGAVGARRRAGLPARARAGGLVGQSRICRSRPCRRSRRSRRARWRRRHSCW